MIFIKLQPIKGSTISNESEATTKMNDARLCSYKKRWIRTIKYHLHKFMIREELDKIHDSRGVGLNRFKRWKKCLKFDQIGDKKRIIFYT